MGVEGQDELFATDCEKFERVPRLYLPVGNLVLLLKCHILQVMLFYIWLLQMILS